MRSRIAVSAPLVAKSECGGRGLGRLSTAAATRAGFALGARFASLEATKNGRTRLPSTRISQDYELSQLLASGLASLRNAEVPWMDDVGLYKKSTPD
jgi:hypothetical protein